MAQILYIYTHDKQGLIHSQAIKTDPGTEIIINYNNFFI